MEQVGTICKGGCKVRTYKEFYQIGIDSEIVLIDELDDLINTYPYVLTEKENKGLWSFREFKIIAVTATLTEGMQNIIKQIMIPKEMVPSFLQFKSAYQFYTG